MSNALKVFIYLVFGLQLSIANAVENGDYKCTADDQSINFPDYIDPPSSLSIDFTMADLLGGGFKITHESFNFKDIIKEEVVKDKEWVPGNYNFSENQINKKGQRSYEIQESQSYQSYAGKSTFKWEKNLSVFSENELIKFEVEYATFFGENLIESNRFKIRYTCD